MLTEGFIIYEHPLTACIYHLLLSENQIKTFWPIRNFVQAHSVPVFFLASSYTAPHMLVRFPALTHLTLFISESFMISLIVGKIRKNVPPTGNLGVHLGITAVSKTAKCLHYNFSTSSLHTFSCEHEVWLFFFSQVSHLQLPLPWQIPTSWIYMCVCVFFLCTSPILL